MSMVIRLSLLIYDKRTAKNRLLTVTKNRFKVKANGADVARTTKSDMRDEKRRSCSSSKLCCHDAGSGAS